MPYDRSLYITRSPQQDFAFDFMLERPMFIADSVFTPKPVNGGPAGLNTKSQIKVYQADTSKLRLMETRKKTDQLADLIDEQLFSRDITLEEHKLGAAINPKDVRDADIPAMLDEARKIKMITGSLLLAREKLAATLGTTSGNYNSALTSAIASGSRWNEAGGDPEADKVTADAALRKMVGRGANAMAIDVTTFDKLRLSPAFRSRTQYTMAGPVNEAIMKSYFNVEHLFIGQAQRDTAVEGATAAIDGFWSDNAIFFVYNPSPALEDISFGHMYMNSQAFWTNAYVDQKRMGPAGPMKFVELGTEYVLDKGYVDGSSTKLFGAGYLFRTVVA